MEQEIIYEKLPTDIAERFVMLMDPILGSGNSATRAIQVRFDTPTKWYFGSLSPVLPAAVAVAAAAAAIATCHPAASAADLCYPE